VHRVLVKVLVKVLFKVVPPQDSRPDSQIVSVVLTPFFARVANLSMPPKAKAAKKLPVTLQTLLLDQERDKTSITIQKLRRASKGHLTGFAKHLSLKTAGVTKPALVHGICKVLKLQVPSKDMPYTTDVDPAAHANLAANGTTLDH